jgi:hypothetical protein
MGMAPLEFLRMGTPPATKVKTPYWNAKFQDGDAMVFGCEPGKAERAGPIK